MNFYTFTTQSRGGECERATEGDALIVRGQKKLRDLRPSWSSLIEMTLWLAGVVLVCVGLSTEFWRSVQSRGASSKEFGSAADYIMSCCRKAATSDTKLRHLSEKQSRFSTAHLIRPSPYHEPPFQKKGLPVLENSQYKTFTFTTTEADDLQPLMDVRSKGFLGADVATSFRMPPIKGKPERYMWIFGDTFVGYSDKDRRLPWAYFIHNSLAFLPEMAGEKKDANMVRFEWNITDSGCPSSIFNEKVVDDECAPELMYYWPISGMGVSYKGKDGEEVSKLILTAVAWVYAPDDIGFIVQGTMLLIVDNPYDPPQQWKYGKRVIPGTNENFNWYSALTMADGSELATSEDAMVYVVGNNGTNIFGKAEDLGRHLLARVSVGKLVDLSLTDMEVWAFNDQDQADWMPYDELLGRGMAGVGIITPQYSETSVKYSPELDAWYAVVVDLLSSQVVLKIGEDITSLSTTVPVYDIPDPYRDLTIYWCYAGKSHPELAQKDELILTYVVNAPGNVDPLFLEGSKDIYVPRFLRVSIMDQADVV